MSYVLGVDLGTTFSAAAIDVDGRTEIVQLGTRAAVIPSVVLLREDGEVLTGEAAERRAQSEPARTAREFKRRLGDPTPLILGGTPYGAESVTRLLLESIVKQVSEQRGEAPELVCITHPAGYGPYKLDLLREAVRLADIGPTFFLSEPEAAALNYASQERVDPGSVIAVYDFGGGTFDAAVLRKTQSGFELTGEPTGIERLGGIDFDEAVYQHVQRVLDGRIEALDSSTPLSQTAVARLRNECRNAKEALSSDTDTSIAVLLPSVQTDVRITRQEFENLIRPRIRDTVPVLERTVRSAGLTMDEVDRILLVGGSSRIPLVAAVVREETGRPVVVDSHPKHAIALGAALEARRRLNELLSSGVPAPVAGQTPAGTTAEPQMMAGDGNPRSAQAIADVTAGTLGPQAAPESAEQGQARASQPLETDAAGYGGGRPSRPLEGSRDRNWLPIILGGAAVAVVAGLAAFFALDGGDENDSSVAEPGDNSPTTIASSPTTPSSPIAGTIPSASPTVLATSTPTLVPGASRILAIQLNGSQYEVEFETAGFTPQLPGEHVHFLFDTVPPSEAGVPGDGPWFVYGGGSPFLEWGIADRPAGATAMCILSANPDHSVRQGTGNCVPLP